MTTNAKIKITNHSWSSIQYQRRRNRVRHRCNHISRKINTKRLDEWQIHTENECNVDRCSYPNCLANINFPKMKVKRCSGCSFVAYCSKKHQKFHWNTTHRYECIGRMEGEPIANCTKNTGQRWCIARVHEHIWRLLCGYKM